MTDLFLIPLDDASHTELDNIPKRAILARKEICEKFADPAQEHAIDAFIEARRATALKAIQHTRTDASGGTLTFFSRDAHLNALPDYDRSPQADKIAALRSCIAVAVSSKAERAKIFMDPLPVNTKMGIFFRPHSGTPWSTAVCSSVEKKEYINSLIRHDPIKGLPTQLAIYEYADGTKILARYYITENRWHTRTLEAATAYRIDPHGVRHRMYTPEDPFIQTAFKPLPLWQQEQIRLYGRHVSVTHVTHAGQCDAFTDGETHFMIYKSKYAHKAQTISGQYLQLDDEGDPLIQKDDASVLEPFYRALASGARVQIGSGFDTVSDYVTWHKNRDVRRIEATSKGLKIQYTDTTYILDTGTQLTLYGHSRSECLRAMVLHAKQHWNGQFTINQADPAAAAELQKIAAELGVTIRNANRPARAQRRTATATQTPLAA